MKNLKQLKDLIYNYFPNVQYNKTRTALKFKVGKKKIETNGSKEELVKQITALVDVLAQEKDYDNAISLVQLQGDIKFRYLAEDFSPKDIIIPERKPIKDVVFNCKNLTEIKIPDSALAIKNHLFW